EREILIEKKVGIKLLIGIAFALKHYLHEEEGNILEDVKLCLNIKSSLPGFENLNRLEVITENPKPNTSSFIKKKKQPIIELKPGYITTQLQKKRIEPPIASNMLTIINLLVEIFNMFWKNFETTISYCLFYSFIPNFMGLFFKFTFQLAASVEVYNPFCYGYNNFNLNYFCETVKREVTAIIKHDPPDDSHLVFDVENKSVSIQSMEDETVNNEVHE
ncbi:1182_t:CDS:2, partial [Gigaspora margarita]